MEKLLKIARREQKRREDRPNVYKLTGWRSFLYYLYYRNRYFLIRESGMWILNFVELGLAAYLLGGMKVRGLALANRYVWLVYAMWGGVTLAERILVARYHAAGKPDRIARTITTFIQMAFVVGLIVAGILLLFSNYIVSPTSNEGKWASILFQNRCFLLVLELVSSSLFMGAYTLSRMYRPLTLSFLLRLWIIVMNIALFPYIGPAALVITLYLRRIVGLIITVHISREWVFSRYGIPKFKIFKLPKINFEIFKEMIPFVFGRSLGVLFAGGYGIIIMQAVSWSLPKYIVLYVMFYQALELLFIIPRRLGRCVFFDVSHLLIWNKVEFLKEYLLKLDKMAMASGIIVAGICVVLGFYGNSFVGTKLSENYKMLRPLLFSAALFFMFHPGNCLWLSVREAAGEIKFNNWLLLITNYIIALPVSIYILTQFSGKLITVEKSGMEFIIVSHSMTFACVIIVDGCMEGVRAVLSRWHIFKYKWLYNSPLRLTKSLLDSESVFSSGKAFSENFSKDLSELWDERFLRARDEGMISFPYWGFKIISFIKNETFRKRGFAIVRILPDYKSSNVWKPGGEGFRLLNSALRKIDYCTKISQYTIAIFLPCVTKEEARKAIAKLHESVGIYLSGCSFFHSAENSVDTIWEIIDQLIGSHSLPTTNFTKQANQATTAWQSASSFFHLSVKNNEQLFEEFDEFCNCWKIKKFTETEVSNFFASGIFKEKLSKFLKEKEIKWFTVDEDFSDFEIQEIFQKVSRRIEMTRVPDFRRFLRADSRGIFPVFFRTVFIGGFVYEPNEIETQAQLIRLSAAIYLWLTLQSIENPVWSEENGGTPKPVLEDMKSDAKEFENFL